MSNNPHLPPSELNRTYNGREWFINRHVKVVSYLYYYISNFGKCRVSREVKSHPPPTF